MYKSNIDIYIYELNSFFQKKKKEEHFVPNKESMAHINLTNKNMVLNNYREQIQSSYEQVPL